MARIKLQAPWIIFYEELEAFFQPDPEVRVLFDEDEHIISMYVDNPTKAEALARILPEEKIFGNIRMKINIIPANKAENSVLSDITDAFKGNPIVNDIVTVGAFISNPITYVIFKREVVQYWNDDLGDAFGNCTTLWQEIAKRLFGELPGIYFCTDERDDDEIAFGVPLGEWP